MEHGEFVIDLYQKRIDAYNELRKLLLRQQFALVNREIINVGVLAEEQLQYLEKISEQEASWQNYLKQFFRPQPMYPPTADFVSQLQLSETERQQFRRLRSKLSKLLEEIREFKETNQLLLENSLSFVQAVLRNITDGGEDRHIYNPRKKHAASRSLINKTL